MTKEIVMKERAARLNTMMKGEKHPVIVEYTSVAKNNHMVEGYRLNCFDYNCIPILYFDSDWWDMTDQELVRLIQDIVDQRALNITTDMFTDRGYTLANVMPRLSSADVNESLFQEKGIVYVPFAGNLLISFYIVVKSGTDSMASVRVTESILEDQGLSVAEILAAATVNVEKASQICSMSAMLQCFGMPFLEEDDEIGAGMLIVTTESQINGAGAMISPAVLQKAMKRLGTREMFILPSSVHELICVPAGNFEAREILEMVREVNGTIVEEEDRLIDSLYLYKEGEITAFSFA